MPDPALQFDELYRHAEFVRGLARRLVADADQADDVAQLAWMTALEHPPRRTGDALRAWLATVVQRLAWRSARTDQRRRRRETDAARTIREEAGDAGSRADHERALDLVMDALKALDDDEHAVVRLRFYAGLTPREIADRLECPIDTVYTRLRRAIGRMRDRLDRRAGGRAEWAAALVALQCVRPVATLPGMLLVAAGAALLLAAAVLGMVGARQKSPPDAPIGSRSAAAPADPAPADHGPAQRRAVTAAPPEALPAAADRRRIVGRVVDARRRPAAHAAVTVWPRQGGSRRLSADAAGRFEVPIDDELAASDEIGVHAVLGGGAVTVAVHQGLAWGCWSIDAPAERDLGVLALADAADVDLLCTAAGNGESVRVSLCAVDEESGGREVTWLGWRAGIADAPLRVRDLPAGVYAVRAESQDGRCGAARFTVPPAREGPIVIAMQPARRLTIRCADERGQPISGVTVRVGVAGDGAAGPLPIAGDERPSDADGIVVLASAPADRALTVFGARPGWVPIDEARFGAAVSRAATAVDLILRAIPRRLIAVDRPWPAGAVAGVELPVLVDPQADGDAPPALAIWQAGALSLWWPERCRGALVIGPDQTLARLHCDGDAAPARAAFEPAGRVRVELRDVDGQPRVAVPIEVSQDGAARSLVRGAITDGEGRADLLMPAGRIAVSIVRPGSRTVLSVFDHANTDRRVACTLPRARSCEVAVTVDGTPGLPGRFTITAMDAAVTIEREDPHTGRLALRVEPAADRDAFELYLSAPGCETPPPLRVAAVPPDESEPLRFDLVSVGWIDVEVINAVATPGVPELQRRFDRLGWRADGTGAIEVGPCRWRFRPPSRGRYRVVDVGTGAATAEIDVAAEPRRVVIDRTVAGEIVGEVVGSPDVGRTRVIATDRLSGGSRSVGLDAAYRFRVPIAPGASVALIAEHPERISGPPLLLDGPRAGVTLRLEPGHAIRFHLAGAEPDGTVAVRLVALPEDRVVIERSVVLTGTAGVITGVPAGHFALAIDAAGSALRCIPAVRVDADVDLGTLPPRHPARLHVVAPGAAGVHVFATWRGIPAITRSALRRDGDTLELADLFGGTWDVNVFMLPSCNGDGPTTRTIQLADGVTQTLRVDPAALRDSP